MAHPTATRQQAATEILHLTLAQQILLWAIRHVAHYGEHSIRSGIGRIVESHLVGQITATIAALAACAPGSGEHAIPAPWSTRIGPVEMDLLHLTALAQDGADIALSVANLDWIARDCVPVFADHLGRIAQALLQADRQLPLMRGRPAADPPANPLSSLPPVLTLSALGEAETILLAAIRIWVFSALRRQPTTLPLADYLLSLHQAALVRPICTMLHNIAVNATRLLNIHCPRCNGLSSDEARLLHGIGSAQREQDFVVAKIIRSWMVAPHSHQLGKDMYELGQRMLRAGQQLPRRQWQFPETDGGSSSWAGLEDRHNAELTRH